MLERVVESWLASVSEKAFEVPFAQLLSLDNYTVVHVARPHGPMEQGKDVLAIAPDGEPDFQLKARDLTLNDWRDPAQPLKGQVEDLLDLPIQHPACEQGRPHTSVLVTTGMLDETLRQTIDAFNAARKAQNKSILHVWVKGQLEAKLKMALGRFLPSQLSNMRDFLQLWLADGQGRVSKADIGAFLHSRIADLSSKSAQKQIAAACGEVIILGSYLAHPYQSAKNRISEIDVWVLVSATLFRVGALSARARKVAIRSLGFIELAIAAALNDLTAECDELESYVQGNPWTDAHVYRARVTITAGYLAAAVLWQKRLGQSLTAVPVLRKFWNHNKGQIWLWGEGAVPYFLAVGWAFDQISANWESERLIILLINGILQENGKRRGDITAVADATIPPRHGLADPYVQVDDIMLEQLGHATTRLGATYVGQSYTLESLIQLLVRRRFRQLLQSLWYRITYVAFQTYRPERPEDLWRWNNGMSGRIESRYVPHPTHWRDLLLEVEKMNSESCPLAAEFYPHFLLTFLLTAPHRLNTATSKILEHGNWQQTAWIIEAKIRGQS